MINLSIQNFIPFIIPFWSQSSDLNVNWTLINESQMTTTAVVDNIVVLV